MERENGTTRKTAAQAQGNSLDGAGSSNTGAATTTLTAITPIPWYAFALSEQSTIPHAGIRAGEIIAWRAWLVLSTPEDYRYYDKENWLFARDRQLRLHSVITHSIWEKGRMQGEIWGSHHGVHAFKSKTDAINYAAEFSVLATLAVGQVALWGDVIEHEIGYRAEFAKVHSINYLVGARWWNRRRLLKRLKETYEVQGSPMSPGSRLP